MNPDQVLICSLKQNGLLPAPFDSNPLARALSGQVIALPDGGGVSLAFTFGDTYLQGRGVVQGGIVATALDFSLGLAPFTLLAEGMTLATTSLTVSFLRPVMAGQVIVEAGVDRAGRSAAFTSARMFDAQRRLVATGTATLSIFPQPEHPVQ